MLRHIIVKNEETFWVIFKHSVADIAIEGVALKNPQFLGEKQQLDTKVYLLNTWSFIFFLPLGPFF